MDFQPKKKKNILTQYVTFLQKSYSKYTQVEKPVVLTTSYEGSDKEEEHEIIPAVSNDNSVNIVSYFESDLSEEEFQNSKDNFFDEDIDDQVKIWVGFQVVKTVLSNEDLVHLLLLNI